jgi:hypothetical protein
MQAGVKEVLRTSRLMPVIDEAHFFFNQGPRMYTRPEMLDWIDAAVCNSMLPIALVTTPQFLACMERAAAQVGWNYRQFRRRCKRYVRLPDKNSPEDIQQVARWFLPGADSATLKQVMAYEALSKRDLSAVGDVVREAKLLVEREGANRIGFEHVRRAVQVLFASDAPWAEMEKRIRQHGAVSRPSRRVATPAPDLGLGGAAPDPVESSPRLPIGPGAGAFTRGQAGQPTAAGQARLRQPEEGVAKRQFSPV